MLESWTTKELGIHYNTKGNLGSCTMPWIIAHKYGKRPPKDHNMVFLGVAAGGG